MEQLRQAHLDLKLDFPFKKPVLDVSTRWNSTFEMVQRGILLRECFECVCEGRITLQSWSFLEWLLKLLLPFKEATESITSQSKVTLSLVVPFFNVLLDTLDFEMKNMNHKNPMYNQLKNAATKLKTYYDVSSELSTIATVIDPRFKLFEYQIDERNGSVSANDVKNQVFKVFDEFYFSQKSIPSNSHAKRNQKSFFDDELIEFGDAGVVFDRFLQFPKTSRKICPLMWWKSNEILFPEVAEMAKDYLAIPASKASVERDFSSARRLITFERCSLNPQTIQAVESLKAWWK